MQCFCRETDSEFILCVEGAPESAWDEIRKAFFEQEQTSFTKRYAASVLDKETIRENFPKYAPDMFTRRTFDWPQALATFAEIAAAHNITWYLTGSMAAVVRGIDIVPHDIDIIVETTAFEKTRVAFREYLLEPFVDNEGAWVVRYFGRLCIAGVMVDIAADESRDTRAMKLESVAWGPYTLRTETLQTCLEVNMQRGREQHASKIRAYLNEHSAGGSADMGTVDRGE